MNEEISCRLFRLIEEDPGISQRELAKAMEISLGKANYCQKALIDKGWLKARNFKKQHQQDCLCVCVDTKWPWCKGEAHGPLPDKQGA